MMNKQKARRYGDSPSRIKQGEVLKAGISTDQGLLTLTLTGGGQLKLGTRSAHLNLSGMECRKSFVNSLHVLCGTLCLLDYNFSPTFILGLIGEAAKLAINKMPASLFKELFFQAQVVSRNTYFPPGDIWVRHPLVVKGVHGHRVAQRRCNLPPSGMQYYLLEIGYRCPHHCQSVFRAFEVIDQPLSLDAGSICAPSQAEEPIIAELLGAFPRLLADLLPSDLTLEPGKWTHIYGSYQNGPNGLPAIESHGEDLTALIGDSELIIPLIRLLKLLSPETLAVVVPEGFNPENIKLKCSTPIHSKLGFIPDGKFGKTRIIAICDIVSQSALTGLNYCLMEVLGQLKKFDATLQQEAIPNYISHIAYKQEYTMPNSSDCTAFTDRLPKELNLGVMKALFGDEVAALWERVVCSRTFAIKSKRAQKINRCKQIKYKVGTPMGLLTSWSSSALVHHLIVRYAHELVGAKYNYLVLGDDVCIGDSRVYNKYLSILESLGMEVSKNKCTTSPVHCEFAKRTFLLTEEGNGLRYVQEVTGLPGNSLLKLLKGDPTGIVGFVSHLSTRQSLVKVSNKDLSFIPITCDSSKVAEQLVILLTYVYNKGKQKLASYYKLRSYLSTWIFQDRNDILCKTIYLSANWRSQTNSQLSYIQGVQFADVSNGVSPQELLNLGVLPFLPFAERSALSILCVTEDLQVTIESSAEALAQMETNLKLSAEQEEFPLKLSMLYKIELSSTISKRLSAKVLNFLFSDDLDWHDPTLLNRLFDYRSTDILSRLIQIYEQRGSVRRREVLHIRDSILGKRLCTAYRKLSRDELSQLYKFRDIMEDYSNMASQIDKVLQNFVALRPEEQCYIEYVDSLFLE
jgi:hypothetical protein